MAFMSNPSFTAWRLVKRSRVDTAFDGEGAYRYGGRWNSKGQRLVYASSTLSLALLEILVHIDPSKTVPELMAVPIEVPKNLLELGPYSALDKICESLPLSLKQTRQIGDIWATTAKQPVLQVPSAIIPIEHNYLFNPAHPDFSLCRIGEPEPLSLDTRLYQNAS